MTSSFQLCSRNAIVVVAMLGTTLLTSCLSSRGQRDPHEPKKWSERIARQKDEMNKVSGFDKMLTTSALGDRGAMKAMGKRSFSTSDYRGNTTYTGAKDYKTKEFNGAGKSNRAETQLSKMGTKDNAALNKSYATKDSRWSGKPSKNDGQTFRGSDSTYKTNAYEPATKSLDQNKRVMFKPASTLDQTKVYAEENVKALLNRN